jgi:hypothetical protein
MSTALAERSGRVNGSYLGAGLAAFQVLISNDSGARWKHVCIKRSPDSCYLQLLLLLLTTRSCCTVLIGLIIINADILTCLARFVNTHFAVGALAIHIAINDATHLHFVICASVF